LKRATRTPNRFITSTRSWPVKSLALFLILLALGSCEEDLGLIGSKKPTSRFGVYFKEFDIPVTTVQTDSLRSSVVAGERLLVGVATDPNFGKITSALYTQFTPTSYSNPKIDKTGKSNFILEGVSVKYVLSSNYYVYGDSANSTENYSLYKITDLEFTENRDYFTNSSVDIEPDVFATSSFNYVHDSIKDHRKRNTDSNAANNRYDTIGFSLPIGPGSLGQQLLDTALANGVYDADPEKQDAKTDSVFRRAFPGFAIVPSSSNTKILGIKTEVDLLSNSTLITLSYSYVKEGNTIRAKYYYSSQIGPGFSKITTDRAGTILSDINSDEEADRHVDFNLSDDYCYLQSGTGLYAKLDFSEVHSYFDANPDTILNMAINAAELTVDIESEAARQHLSMPNYLLFRVVNSSNHFFKVPTIAVSGQTEEVADPQYVTNYNSLLNGSFLDARDDLGARLAVPLTKSTATANAYYSAYISDFMQRFLRVPANFQKIYYMALIPADAGYGKSLHGLSFKKDKVKLRVYYTKTL
jgi:Domain of unknown function (DUF4270)